VQVTFEYLELTRASLGTLMCDCGVIWRLMVLGVQRLWAGARAFHGWEEEGEAMMGWWACDVVVTPCDLRRLEMVLLALIDSLLLLCLG